MFHICPVVDISSFDISPYRRLQSTENLFQNREIIYVYLRVKHFLFNYNSISSFLMVISRTSGKNKKGILLYQHDLFFLSNILRAKQQLNQRFDRIRVQRMDRL